MRTGRPAAAGSIMDPNRNQAGTPARRSATVSVNLSIKNVPDELAEALRERARRHRRSLQGELLAILEETLGGRRQSVADVLAELRSTGLTTPRESARLVREDRDGR